MSSEIQALQKQIVSACKTLNSRLRRLKKAGLPASSMERIQTAKNMGSPLVTESGFISSSYKGMTQEQLKAKLKWIRGITEQTETVPQARELVKKRAEQWGVDEQTAADRIRSGRVFAQVLNANPMIFESDDVNDTITEFSSTPTYDELENALYKKYGSQLADVQQSREYVRRWIERTRELPYGVQGKFDRMGHFYFYDEYANEDNELEEV